MQGFIVNDKATTVDALITSIGTSFVLAKAIKLEGDTDVDAKAKALPNAAYNKHCYLLEYINCFGRLVYNPNITNNFWNGLHVGEGYLYRFCGC